MRYLIEFGLRFFILRPFMKLCLSKKASQLQLKLKSTQNVSQSELEAYKAETRSRDDCIQKLRQDLLAMQEKRDVSVSESESLASKNQQLESRLFFLEDENVHLTARIKQCQKEIQEWKASYEDVCNKV